MKSSTGEPGSGSFREKFRNTGSDARHRLCRMLYVPVNPMNPTERLRKIMEKLDPEVIISDEKGKEQLAAVGNGLENK